MTQTQTARLAGFRASLSVRGVALTHVRSTTTIQGLRNAVTPTDGEFETNDNRSASRLQIEASTAPAVRIGDEFTEEGWRHRVTVIEDQPGSVTTSYFCESIRA